jgi:hypothetical protein
MTIFLPLGPVIDLSLVAIHAFTGAPAEAAGIVEAATAPALIRATDVAVTADAITVLIRMSYPSILGKRDGEKCWNECRLPTPIDVESALAKRMGSIPLILPKSSAPDSSSPRDAGRRRNKGKPNLRLDYLTKRLQFQFNAHFNWLFDAVRRTSQKEKAQILSSVRPSSPWANAVQRFM